jgi:FkbH-like protein
VEAIAWGQGDHAQLHGLYQSALRRLADAGVLLAIASKNELEVVGAALERKDLLIGKQAFFPITANWGPKSDAVTEILRVWNISADAVVVVDDSRMELEEIRSVHPEINCLEFTPKDPARCLRLLEELRDLFGKPVIGEEDRLRSNSVRQREIFEKQKPAQDMPAFLLGLAGKVTFDGRKNPGEMRFLELINKTNQWNLNGVRVSEGEWLRLLAQKDSFVLGVSYEDRYGALGKIGVMAGVLAPESIIVEHWVLSCRAFSRRIEDHMLRQLFESKLFGLAPRDNLRLRYQRTDKNKPAQEFLARLGVATNADGLVSVVAQAALEASRDLPHTVHEAELVAPAVAGPGLESGGSGG